MCALLRSGIAHRGLAATYRHCIRCCASSANLRRPALDQPVDKQLEASAVIYTPVQLRPIWGGPSPTLATGRQLATSAVIYTLVYSTGLLLPPIVAATPTAACHIIRYHAPRCQA